MKKIHLATALILSVSSMFFVSCQKEQNNSTSVSNQSTSVTTETVKGVSVASNDIAGMISGDAAAAMQAAFINKFGKNVTQHVAFSTKDLAGYFNLLVNKYKSDSIYVNFGVYDQNTANSKANVGKLTIFFMGKNQATKSGNIRSQSTDDASSDLNASNYLNHGGIWP